MQEAQVRINQQGEKWKWQVLRELNLLNHELFGKQYQGKIYFE
jgi:hypothetical protein